LPLFAWLDELQLIRDVQMLWDRDSADAKAARLVLDQCNAAEKVALSQ